MSLVFVQTNSGSRLTAEWIAAERQIAQMLVEDAQRAEEVARDLPVWRGLLASYHFTSYYVAPPALRIIAKEPAMPADTHHQEVLWMAHHLR